MRYRDIVARAARSLRQAKARTLLTSLAIAVGAFTLTLSIAAGEGARQYADALIGSNVNPQVLFIVKDRSLFEGGPLQNGLREYDPDLGATPSGRNIELLTMEDIEQLKSRGDLENIVPTYNLSVRYIEFEGIETKYASTVSAYDDTITTDVAEGTLPERGTQIENDEIVMPESFAETLVRDGKIDSIQDVVGKNVTLTVAQTPRAPSSEELAAAIASGDPQALQELAETTTETRTYVLRALTSRSATSLAGGTALLIAPDEAKAIAEYTTKGTENYQKYVGVTALAVEGNDPVDIKADLESKDFGAQTAQDLQDLLFTIVNILQGIVIGFGILALIASVFGIINTQYISVLERTQQIGLMKALGMRGRHVSRLFQFEAAWIGMFGGAIGAAIAVVLGVLLNPWITEQLQLGEGNSLLVFQIMPIGVLVVALSLVAMIAGYLPARKAAKLDPIEALRTE